VLRIGLTGGIGAGKSTVADTLAGLGAVVVDADVLAREVVAPGTPGLAAVAREFGDGVIGADGALDRAALGRLVFADQGRRRALESITHPLVAKATADRVAAAAADAVVVHDVPLIVEKAMGPLYHLVVVVDAPEAVRVQRLVDSRGMTADDAWSRIRAQAGDDARRAAADVWIDTDRARERVAEDVRDLWTRRLVPYERNVRTRTVVRRPESVVLSPHDPQWAATAARLAGRVRHAAGDRHEVAHIGSTAVDGLPAKAVIDLQLGVGSLDEADALLPALEEAGFPRLRVAADQPVSEVDPDPSHWHKRLHGGTDPAVVVHLHVRERSGPGWRTALLLRDWLRSVPDERAAYLREKRRLATSGLTSSGYADAKDLWWQEALPRALAWADATGWAVSG
jgi:dephospho-CoA kinase